MTLEQRLFQLLSPLVSGRAFPDVLPDGVAFPCITFQQVGGEAGWYLEGKMPSHRHARIQINIWAKRREQASALARQVEKAICESGLTAEPLGAFVGTYEEMLKLYGTRQDFGIWHEDS